MISSVYGLVNNIVDTEYCCYIRSGGLEFELTCSEHSLLALKEKRESRVRLYTYFLLTDRAMQLFGFFEYGEKECFIKLIKVQGIGPKIAIKILSNISWTKLTDYALNRKENELAKLPGIGTKKASFIVLQFSKKQGTASRKTNQSTQSNPNNSKDLNDAAREIYKVMKEQGYKDDELAGAFNTVMQEAADQGIDPDRNKDRYQEFLLNRAITKLS